MIEVKTVTISERRYKKLMRDSAWLGCLEAAGVDNWDGISHAFELSDEEEDEDD